MDRKDIPLELRVEFPDLAIYCTDDAQKPIVKALNTAYNRLGKGRFIEEVAVTIRSLKLDVIEARSTSKEPPL